MVPTNKNDSTVLTATYQFAGLLVSKFNLLCDILDVPLLFCPFLVFQPKSLILLKTTLNHFLSDDLSLFYDGETVN